MKALLILLLAFVSLFFLVVLLINPQVGVICNSNSASTLGFFETLFWEDEINHITPISEGVYELHTWGEICKERNCRQAWFESLDQCISQLKQRSSA